MGIHKPFKSEMLRRLRFLGKPTFACQHLKTWKFRKYKGHLDRQLMRQNKNHQQNKKFDIAVMIVRTPFIINEYVIPACLPPSRIQLQHGLGVVSGLGRTYDKTSQTLKLSEYLQRGLIEIIPGSKCKNSTEFERIFNGAHMLCGLGKKRHGSRVDSCHGNEICVRNFKIIII